MVVSDTQVYLKCSISVPVVLSETFLFRAFTVVLVTLTPITEIFLVLIPEKDIRRTSVLICAYFFFADLSLIENETSLVWRALADIYQRSCS